MCNKCRVPSRKKTSHSRGSSSNFVPTSISSLISWTLERKSAEMCQAFQAMLEINKYITYFFSKPSSYNVCACWRWWISWWGISCVCSTICFVDALLMWSRSHTSRASTQQRVEGYAYVAACVPKLISLKPYSSAQSVRSAKKAAQWALSDSLIWLVLTFRPSLGLSVETNYIIKNQWALTEQLSLLNCATSRSKDICRCQNFNYNRKAIGILTNHIRAL